MILHIYKITNKITGKIYIGKTSLSIKDRWKTHCKCAQRGIRYRLYKSIRRFGEDNFSIEIIESTKSEEYANLRERYWIKHLKTFMPEFGYNSTMGGDGVIHRKETKERMSNSHRGLHHSEETKRKISESNMGRPGTWTGLHHSDKTKRKLSLMKKGISLGSLSAETRQKMSDSRKGWIFPEEVKKKLSIAKTLYWKKRREELKLIRTK
jgi:group I intron endonuclease